MGLKQSSKIKGRCITMQTAFLAVCLATSLFTSLFTSPFTATDLMQPAAAAPRRSDYLAYDRFRTTSEATPAAVEKYKQALTL
ncbi:MAG TPA: hypothetical protein PL012_15380 [Candidatus Obscuribacter sp.]|nr:hypothetical protein [Candidatus Obscuribacter sp.]